MKMLVIGMDGAQIDTFRRGWTPFLASLVERGNYLSLYEDLISRGWVEILTGAHGMETGGLYDRPALNKSLKWGTKFKINDIAEIGEKVKPLWQVLNERGYSVGIMNVPTTAPAPKVNGFFVSGGGGGGAVLQNAVIEQCYPEEILEKLHDMNYIVDERFESLFAQKKLYTPYKLFGRLEDMVVRRTDAFVNLAAEYKVDFGFIVYKSSSVIAETLLLPLWDRELKGGDAGNTELIKAVKRYYRTFDEKVKHLFNHFPEAEIILVSDHAMQVNRWLVNANAFLQEYGFQQSSRKNKRFYHFLGHLKQWVPVSLRTAMGKSKKIRNAYMSVTPFDPKNSTAFSMVVGDWMNGIFVNDCERFGGPVQKKDVKAVREKIVQSFNSDKNSIEHGLLARVKSDEQASASEYYPDIVLDLPDGYVTSNKTQVFIEKFVAPKRSHEIISHAKGLESSCSKAQRPLAVNSRNAWNVQVTSEKNDLRLVYDHIITTFT